MGDAEEQREDDGGGAESGGDAAPKGEEGEHGKEDCGEELGADRPGRRVDAGAEAPGLDHGGVHEHGTDAGRVLVDVHLEHEQGEKDRDMQGPEAGDAAAKEAEIAGQGVGAGGIMAGSAGTGDGEPIAVGHGEDEAAEDEEEVDGQVAVPQGRLQRFEGRGEADVQVDVVGDDQGGREPAQAGQGAAFGAGFGFVLRHGCSSAAPPGREALRTNNQYSGVRPARRALAS